MRYLLLVIMLLVLAACTPVTRFATDTINDQVGDQASLSYAFEGDVCGEVVTDNGICFDPGAEAINDLVVDVQADTLTSFPEICEPTERGASCRAGDISSDLFIPLDGTNVSALASYRRPNGTRVFMELARLQQ